MFLSGSICNGFRNKKAGYFRRQSANGEDKNLKKFCGENVLRMSLIAEEAGERTAHRDNKT